jgi:hypothetical protein
VEATRDTGTDVYAIEEKLHIQYYAAVDIDSARDCETSRGSGDAWQYGTRLPPRKIKQTLCILQFDCLRWRSAPLLLLLLGIAAVPAPQEAPSRSADMGSIEHVASIVHCAHAHTLASLAARR